MNATPEFPPLTWAEIDLGALAHNMRELRRITSDSAAMMAVVKADGYGHGAVPVSKVALANGAEYLAVARISEVVQLRNAGIHAPLLLFGFCHPCYIGYLAENDARASVNSTESARLLSEEAGRLGVKLKVHAKVDTGMGRLGLFCHGLAEEVETSGAMHRVVTSILEISSLHGSGGFDFLRQPRCRIWNWKAFTRISPMPTSRTKRMPGGSFNCSWKF